MKTWNAGTIPASQIDERFDRADLDPKTWTVYPSSTALRRAQRKAKEAKQAQRRAKQIVEGKDADGNIVQFPEARAACRAYGLPLSTISEALRNGQRAVGRYWRHAGEPWPKPSAKLKAVRNTTTGQTFYSAGAAALTIAEGRSEILRVSRGILRAARRRSEYMGAKWELAA